MKADNFLFEALVDDPKPCRKAVIRLELRLWFSNPSGFERLESEGIRPT